MYNLASFIMELVTASLLRCPRRQPCFTSLCEEGCVCVCVSILAESCHHTKPSASRLPCTALPARAIGSDGGCGVGCGHDAFCLSATAVVGLLAGWTVSDG